MAGTVTRKRKKTAKTRKGSRHLTVADVRKAFGVTMETFARLSGYSVRSIAGWEAGNPLRGPAKMKMQELGRLADALRQVIKSDAIPDWLDTPNDAFDDLKPLEVIERGEIDRLWRMIFNLESGIPG